MTDDTGSNDARKIAFDRMKDDPCHRCRFSVMKTGGETLAPWVRPYGCTCLDRITTCVDGALRHLQFVKSDMSSGKWQPNRSTIDTMNCASRLTTEAADLLWDLFKYGYMEPETICVFECYSKEKAE